MSARDGAVVVAWTPEALGQAALEHGVEEARARGLDLVVVNATRGDALVDPRFAGEDELARLERELAAGGQPVQVRRSVGGDVAEQVLAVAGEVGARLVVIGVRQRSPVGKLLMGSVAQRILLTASCPVLAVKPGTAPRGG